MKTFHLIPSTLDRQIDDVVAELRRSGHAGPLSVTVASEEERVSPADAAKRLGFSRQHVRRLIAAGELEAEQMEGSSYWKIPVRSLIAFEERRELGRQQSDAFSRALDEAGAPLE